MLSNVLSLLLTLNYIYMSAPLFFLILVFIFVSLCVYVIRLLK